MEAEATTNKPLSELLGGARAGDDAAWEGIVRRFAPLIVSITRSHRLSESDSRDVMQLVWLKLLEHLNRIREPNALPGWISVTTRNACLDTIRVNRRTVSTPSFRDERSNGAAPDESIMTSVDRREVVAAWAHLGASCRELLAMCCVEPRVSYADISQALGIPIGSIGPTRGRCLETLRQKLSPQG